MKPIIIDPTRLDRDTTPLLQAFLNSSQKTRLSSEKTYTVELKTTSEPSQIMYLPFQLTHSLLVRPSKYDNFRKRVEIFGDKLCNSKYSQVFESLGVLKVEDNLKFKREGKPRIIKEISLKPSKEKKIRKEVIKTNAGSDYLHCKSALFSRKSGYLIMRRGPGRDLFEIMEKLDDGVISLDLEKRLFLTLELIRAVKLFHKKQLIHRDLKPENMMVDLETMEVLIIDYELSKRVEKMKIDKERRTAGSIPFLAPEVYLFNTISQAGDIFSLGLILAQLWGDIALTKLIKPKMDDFEQIMALSNWHKKEDRYDGLFDEIDLPESMKPKLKSLINSLTRYKAAERIDLARATSICKTLLLEVIQSDRVLYEMLEEGESYESSDSESSTSTDSFSEYGSDSSSDESTYNRRAYSLNNLPSFTP